MARTLSLTAAAVLSTVSAACASVPEAAPTPRAPAVVSMAPIPDDAPASRSPSRSARGRGSGWDRPDGVNGTLRPYTVAGVTYAPRHQPDYDEQGTASWYGAQHHGRRTASGEVFDMGQASAAHRTLPMGSIVEVENLDNGRTTRLRVNDRGPFSRSRILDVSREGARQLGFLERGSARVRVRYVGDGAEDRPLLARAAAGVADVVTAPVRLAAAVAMAPVRAAAEAFDGDDDGEGWAVQTGAFADRDNAQRLADRLQGAGEVRIRGGETDGRRLYRVLVGGYRDADEAARGLSRVAALGVADARVVRGF